MLFRHFRKRKLIGRFWPNARVYLAKWRPENLATLAPSAILNIWRHRSSRAGPELPGLPGKYLYKSCAQIYGVVSGDKSQIHVLLTNPKKSSGNPNWCVCEGGSFSQPIYGLAARRVLFEENKVLTQILEI
jgi:hypothetical protein